MPKKTKKEEVLRQLAEGITVQPWQPKKPKTPQQQRVRHHIQHNFRRSLEKLSDALDSVGTFADKGSPIYSSHVENLANRDDADALKEAIRVFRKAVLLPGPSEKDGKLDPRISIKLNKIFGIAD
jgi:hypothetical protein